MLGGDRLNCCEPGSRTSRLADHTASMLSYTKVPTEAAVTLDLATRHQITLRIRQALPQIRNLLLFGSQARGDAKPDSDIDLLLIVPDGEDRIAMAVAARRSLMGMGLGFDVLVIGESEWQRVRSSPAWFHRQMTHDAVRMDDAA